MSYYIGLGLKNNAIMSGKKITTRKVNLFLSVVQKCILILHFYLFIFFKNILV